MRLQESLELSHLKGRILVTGHNGFKGMWLITLLKKLGCEVYGVSLPADGRALSEDIVASSVRNQRIFDLNDYDKVNEYLELIQPRVIIHLAAQPLVRLSYSQPFETFRTNVMGTATLLDCAFNTNHVECIAVVTTDKVYQNDNSGTRFNENDSLRGSDPYSASKVGTEAVVDAWRAIRIQKGSGPKILSLRAGNVIGGGDLAPDRLIPDLVRSYISKKPFVMRNPESTRPWQHAIEPLYGYLQAINFALSGGMQDTFNFGPDDKSLTVREVVDIFNSVFENQIPVTYNSDEVTSHEAKLLEISSIRSQTILGWNPIWDQQSSTLRTAEWWEQKLKRALPAASLCNKDIDDYLSKWRERI